MSVDKDAAARVMQVVRKTFTAGTITLEQEKQLLRIIRRAQTEDAAFTAVDLMYAEGSAFPDDLGFRFRKALERVHAKLALENHLEGPPGPWVEFSDWAAAQDEETRRRIQRVAPSLKHLGLTP